MERIETLKTSLKTYRNLLENLSNLEAYVVVIEEELKYRINDTFNKSDEEVLRVLSGACMKALDLSDNLNKFIVSVQLHIKEKK